LLWLFGRWGLTDYSSWPQSLILPISTSQVARITGLSHLPTLCIFHYFCVLSRVGIKWERHLTHCQPQNGVFPYPDPASSEGIPAPVCLLCTAWFSRPPTLSLWRVPGSVWASWTHHSCLCCCGRGSSSSGD
jgi:hypothetical protein